MKEDTLSLPDIKDVTKIAQVSGRTIDDVQDSLREAFLDESGNVSVTEEALTDSGMYTYSEVDRILSDESLIQSVSNRISQIIDLQEEAITRLCCDLLSKLYL